jgi:hypothetical protein
MGNLVEHAKFELELAGLLDPKKDFYGGLTGKAVLELLECFESQGHSGMSAEIVVQLFEKLANFKPIGPITGSGEEWSDDPFDGETYQNKRLGSLFKIGLYGKAYYLDAIVWQEPNGCCFTGEVDGITSRQYVKFPFEPKTFYVKIDKNRKIIDLETLQKAFEYYGMEINN